MSNARIFISYSHAAEKRVPWKARLVRHLEVFTRHGLIEAWDDEKIPAGWRWEREIEQAIHNARLAVILLTKEALESEFILQRELVPLSRREARDGLIVIPILCEPCPWDAHPWLKQVQIRPFEAKPLSTLSDVECERTLRQLATEIAEEVSRVALAELPKPDQPLPPERVYLDRFPLAGAPGLQEEKLIGREQELALLDLAFAQLQTAIVSLVAWGGVGKTMLVQHWLKRLEHRYRFGARRVYAWSFYSQGTTEDRQASEDLFLAHALQWFDVQCEPTLSPWDKGRLLADAVARERTLLILDGIEPLQYPPGPRGGQLRAPGVQSLLKHVARRANDVEHAGLCLVMTRETLTDLTDFQRREGSPWGSVLRVELRNLTDEAGAAVLHHAGVRRAGAAEIHPNDVELLNASRQVDGHALTLNLLGRFLSRAHNGDIRRRDLVNFVEADCRLQGGTTFKMLAAFDGWFSRGGAFCRQSLAILRLLGLFERPANSDCIAALRQQPVIKGLTDALFVERVDEVLGIPLIKSVEDEEWNSAVSFLTEFGLVTKQPDKSSAVRGYSIEVAAEFLKRNHVDTEVPATLPEADVFQPESVTSEEQRWSLDTHPLIREYFRQKLGEIPDYAKEQAHCRLFRHLEDSAPYWPDGLTSLAPLYGAVVHGCEAGLHEDALELFRSRILRGTKGPNQRYATKILGAFGDNLAVLAHFFVIPWNQVVESLEIHDQAWIRSEVAGDLRDLGRVDEALEITRTNLQTRVEIDDWHNAAISANNLVQLELLAGNISEAITSSQTAVAFSDLAKSEFQRILNRATRARALHQARYFKEAHALFREAEFLQKQYGWDMPVLFSISGFFYCDFLLQQPSLVAWQAVRLGWVIGSQHHVNELRRIQADKVETVIQLCAHVEGRARCDLMAREAGVNDVLSRSLDHLILSRLAMCQMVLATSSIDAQKHRKIVSEKLGLAIDGLRTCGTEWLALGLVANALSKALEGQLDAARAELDEAWLISDRGRMRLLMADIHLSRARIFSAQKPYPWHIGRQSISGGPNADLAAARALIEQCAYWCRREELKDAEQGALHRD